MTPQQRRLALALGITQALAWASTYYLPAVMIGPAAAALGLSRTLLLGGFSWALLIAGLCSPLVGRRIDRIGGRLVLVAGALVCAAGMLVLAAAQGAVQWYLGWSVLGIGMALGLYDAAFATIGRLLGREARPAIVGVTLMAGFASTIGWSAGAWAVAHMGWRTMLVVYAGVQAFVVLPIVLTFVPGRLPPPLPPAEAPPAKGGPTRSAAFALMAIFFTARAVITVIVSVNALALLAGIGLGREAAVATAALIGPCQVGARVLDWRLARGVSPVTSAWMGAALLPAGILATLAGAPAAVFALCYGMSNGILTISRGTLPLHVFGPNGYATMLGRLALPTLLAQAVAPTLLAPLIDGLPAAVTLGSLAVAATLALLCLLPLRR
jgi:MFS family permease